MPEKTLTQNAYTSLEKRGINLVCARCGKPIEPGDRIYISASGRRRYHSECFNSMFIDIKDE